MDPARAQFDEFEFYKFDDGAFRTARKSALTATAAAWADHALRRGLPALGYPGEAPADGGDACRGDSQGKNKGSE